MSSILAISGSVIYYCAICEFSGSVVLLGNYLVLIVPFVRVQYELFLAMLFVTVQYELFGHVLRCTFTVQEQFQVVGCCSM